MEDEEAEAVVVAEVVVAAFCCYNAALFDYDYNSDNHRRILIWNLEPADSTSGCKQRSLTQDGTAHLKIMLKGEGWMI